jgi:hypothetical protein
MGAAAPLALCRHDPVFMGGRDKPGHDDHVRAQGRQGPASPPPRFSTI